jgi:hypothetical protein
MPAHGAPPIECELYEFQPKGRELLTIRQGYHNSVTNKYDYIERYVPPLSLKDLTIDDIARFDKYFTALADNRKYMSAFPAYCYWEQPDDFLARLLQIMVDYKPQSKKEVCNFSFLMFANH